MSELQIPAEVIEAAARATYEVFNPHLAWGDEWPSSTARPNFVNGGAAAIRAAVEEVECPTCEGYGGVGHDQEGTPNPEPCWRCRGTGSLLRWKVTE